MTLRLHIRCALCAREVPLRAGIVAQHRGTTERLGVCGGSGAVATPAAIGAWLDGVALAARVRADAAAREAEHAAAAAQRARAEVTAALAWVGRRRGEIDAKGLTGDFSPETLVVTTGEVRPEGRHPVAAPTLTSPHQRPAPPLRAGALR